jgi:hypothetical protein
MLLNLQHLDGKSDIQSITLHPSFHSLIALS